MNLISIENISKSYSDKVLFNNISLGINEGQKIGLIGINGTGKSTLLKIIAGLENIESGNIITKNNLKVEYLAQNTNFNEENTVMEHIFKGDTPVIRLVREYETLINKLEINSEDTASQTRLTMLSGQMDALNAWNIESEAKIILTKLGIINFDEKVKNLSGGQKKRVALAGALIAPADLLVLDEPTNHIDDDTVNWLEAYLNSRKGSVIMVTHDRYFLDRVANEILELFHGKLYTYEGNYSKYLEAKAERLNMLEANEQKKQNLIRRELKWIKRGAKARSTKQKARIDRFNELQEQDTELSNDKVEISTLSTRLGKKIIEINNISKSFGNRVLISDFSYIISRNDRIGIIGPNGRGKTTLLKMICGIVSPDSGTVEIGETVKLGYFSQEYMNIDNSMRVIDYIKETAEFIKTSDKELISASQMLEKFLFEGAIQYTPIAKLSGGEKRRLFLLKVLMSAPNVLLLDEPTNDLDIETLTILEEYIEQFNGTVIAVSHDRYFLDKMSNKIFAFEGNGKILEHTGNYSDYIEFIKENEEQPEKIKVKKQVKERNANREKTLKFTFKEQREYDQIDNLIEDTEKALAKIDDKINNCSSDYTKLQELLAEKKSIEGKLEYLMQRWVYLNELAEKINNKS